MSSREYFIMLLFADINPVYDIGDEGVANSKQDGVSIVMPSVQSQPQIHQLYTPNMKKNVPVFNIETLSCLNWSCQQVADWLTKHKLQKYIKR